jgi:hypothetical protein
MLYAGLDLSRKRLDFRLLDEAGETLEVGAAAPDADGLRGLARRAARFQEPVRAAIESMNGARFVHDQLELAGWQVEIADALKVKGLAPLACKTDRIDAWVLAELFKKGQTSSHGVPEAGSVFLCRFAGLFRLRTSNRRQSPRNLPANARAGGSERASIEATRAPRRSRVSRRRRCPSAEAQTLPVCADS